MWLIASAGAPKASHSDRHDACFCGTSNASMWWVPLHNRWPSEMASSWQSGFCGKDHYGIRSTPAQQHQQHRQQQHHQQHPILRLSLSLSQKQQRFRDVGGQKYTAQYVRLK